MRKMLEKCSLVLFGLSLLLGATRVVLPTSVQAQAEATNSPVLQLQDEYRVQLIDYRDQYAEYSIDIKQYAQLQTLASLEKAVQSTREVMIARDEVLITHFRMLEKRLEQTTGLDLQRKGLQLTKLADHISKMNAHRVKVEAATDRFALAQVVSEFAPLQLEGKKLSDETMTLIAYGQLQTVYDKTASVRDEIRQEVSANETNPITLAEKQRAFVEIDEKMSSTGKLLGEVRSGFSTGRGSSSVDRVDEKLGQAYAGISQTLAFLDEVLGQ